MFLLRFAAENCHFFESVLSNMIAYAALPEKR